MTIMTDLNEITTPQSLLTVPTSSFPLWSIALISLSVLVVTSMVFVMTVLLCRILKQQTTKRHNYSIRPQQGLHLNYSLLISIDACQLFLKHSPCNINCRQYSFTRFC